jgi:hypothetical protein
LVVVFPDRRLHELFVSKNPRIVLITLEMDSLPQISSPLMVSISNYSLDSVTAQGLYGLPVLLADNCWRTSPFRLDILRAP